jgi:alpha-tubulin suppressor-like RCC1 family protein
VDHDDSCALTTDGRAYCWGGNSDLSLGVDEHCAETDPDLSQQRYGYCDIPTEVSTSLRFGEIRTVGPATCAMTPDRTSVYCWGTSEGGILGPTTAPKMCRLPPSYPCDAAPNLAMSGQAIATLSASKTTTMCAVVEDGNAYCWGKIQPNGRAISYNGYYSSNRQPFLIPRPARIPNTVAPA